MPARKPKIEPVESGYVTIDFTYDNIIVSNSVAAVLLEALDKAEIYKEGYDKPSSIHPIVRGPAFSTMSAKKYTQIKVSQLMGTEVPI